LPSERCVSTVAAAAIVGLKDDERVLLFAALAQSIEYFADGVVHASDRGAVALQIFRQLRVGVFGDIPIWRLHAGPRLRIFLVGAKAGGTVWGVEAEVEKPRPISPSLTLRVCIAANESQRLAFKQIGGVGALIGFRSRV